MVLPKQLSSIEHFNLIHPKLDFTAFVGTWRKDEVHFDKVTSKTPNLETVLGALAGQEDVGMSVNEFFGPRREQFLASLNACFVDIDDNTNLEQVLDALTRAKIPEPGLVTWSGTGLHLYWLVDPASPKALPRWKAIQKRLYEALKHLGADARCLDASRVLRLSGTLNLGETARSVVFSSERWTLPSLANEILGPLPLPPKPPAVKPVRSKRKLSRRKRVSHHKKTRKAKCSNRWKLVIDDLFRIAEHHGSIPEGYRDTWVFFLAVALSWTSPPDHLLAKLLGYAEPRVSLNENEISTLASTTVRRAKDTKSARKEQRYPFRRQTLFDRLSGIIPADLLPELRAIIPDDEYYVRKKARDLGRSSNHNTGHGVRTDNLAKRQEAIRLRMTGASLRAIGAELGVNAETVRRWLPASSN